MSLIPYVPDEIIGLLVGGALFYLVGVQGIRAAVRKETKVNAIEQVLKQLGFKNMKVSDLNAGSLDEVGFARLITLLRDLRPAGSMPGGDAMSQLNSLVEWGRQLKVAQSVQAVGGVPANVEPPANQ